MKLLLICLLTVFVSFVQVYSQPPAEDEETIRVETSLVVVPTKVTDRNNKNIVNLQRENFRLYEDGIEQTIGSFEDAAAPFTIALVLDVSDSTGKKLTEIKAAAIAFLKELRPADRVAIFTFDNRLTKVAEGTVDDLANIQNSIAFSVTGGGTSLYDSTGDVINDYFARVGGKKAMIIFTDGIDTQSVRRTFADSVRLAEESDVLIYPIQYETITAELNKRPGITDIPFGASVQIVTAKGEPLPAAYKRGTLYLQSLATGTGGRFFFADTVEKLSKSFAEIAAELSQLYALSYYPQNQLTDGKRRKIKVTVNVPRAVVRPRKTYIFNRAKK